MTDAGRDAPAGEGEIGRRLVVRGRVQGVSFRFFTRREAASLGLAGWVRNRRDGTVEAEVWGSPSTVETFAERLRSGPPAARVDALEIGEPTTPRPRGGFDIIY